MHRAVTEMKESRQHELELKRRANREPRVEFPGGSHMQLLRASRLLFLAVIGVSSAVVGAIFIKMLTDRATWKKWSRRAVAPEVK
jgi:hypothetical protein